MKKDLQERISFLKDQIANKAPLFADYVNLSSTLHDYSHQLQEYTPHKVHQERQGLLKEVIESETKRIFGHSFDINSFDLGNQSVYSIVDHHDILNHQLFISPNILSNISSFKLKHDKPKAIITFSDSGIPIDHFGNRRGMTFNEKPIRLFTHKERHKISYAISRRDFPLSKKIPTDFNSSESDFVKHIEKNINDINLSGSAKSYTDQISIINKFLWKQLFEDKIKDDVPELIHLSGEVIVVKILEQLLRDQSNLFHKILFSHNLRNEVIKYFDGIKGCWNNDKSYGTHFFWRVNSEGGADRLWLNDNKLMTQDGNAEMSMDLEVIMERLRNKEIYPGLFLTYGILIFYFGIKPLTGFASTDYLGKMQARWVELLDKTDTEEAKLIKGIPTNNLIQGPKLIFDYIDGKYKDMYTLDIIYKSGIREDYLEKIQNMSFNQVLLPGLLDVYKTYINADTSPLDLTLDDLLNDGFYWLQK